MNKAGCWQTEYKAQRALVGWHPLVGMKTTRRARV
jgi:hypothetical protein